MTCVVVGPHAANQWIVGESEVDLSRSTPHVARKLKVPAEPKDVVIDLGRAAIVVVDMQNDFCSGDGYLGRTGLDCGGANALIGPINRLLDAVRPHHVPVIWLNWAVRPDRLSIGPAMPQIHASRLGDSRAPSTHLVAGMGGWGAFEGEWGARIAEGLHVGDNDIHVRKHRFSGFFNTELDSILRNMGISTLFFAGVAMDICVFATLQDAMFLGYDALMLEDCVATNSPVFCVEATRHHVTKLYGFMTSSTVFLGALSSLESP